MEWNRPGRWQGSHRGRATRSSPPPSQGLRKRHRPSGEVQFAKTAPDPGGSGEPAGEQSSKQHPRGGGGGREGESGEQGDGTEKGETNTDRLFQGGQLERSGGRVTWTAQADRGRRRTGGGSRGGAQSKRRHRAAATRRRRQEERRNGHSDGARKRPRLRQGRAASKGCGALTSRRGRPHPGAVGRLDDECHPLVAKDDKGLTDHSEERAVRGSGGGQLSGH